MMDGLEDCGWRVKSGVRLCWVEVRRASYGQGLCRTAKAEDGGGDFIVLMIMELNIDVGKLFPIWLSGEVLLGAVGGGLLFLEGKRQPFIAVASLSGDIGRPSDPLGLCLALLGIAVASSRVRTGEVQFTLSPPANNTVTPHSAPVAHMRYGTEYMYGTYQTFLTFLTFWTVRLP